MPGSLDDCGGCKGKPVGGNIAVLKVKRGGEVRVLTYSSRHMRPSEPESRRWVNEDEVGVAQRWMKS